MNHSAGIFAVMALAAAGNAYGLEPACEVYLQAAEKSARQPARHSTTDTEGLRLEMLIADGKMFMKEDGKWRQQPTTGASPLVAEQQFIASIRAGKYPISGCRKVGSENVEGIATTIYTYTLKIPGMPGGEARVFIGTDGLVHAQTTADAKVRHRYSGVTAPRL